MDTYIRKHEDDFIGQAEESLPIKSCRRLFEFQRLSASSLVNLFISNPPLLNYEHPKCPLFLNFILYSNKTQINFISATRLQRNRLTFPDFSRHFFTL